MAKFTKASKFTYFNIMICISAILVIAYILGYTNMTFQTKEGMSKKAGGLRLELWFPIGFLILIVLNGIIQTSRERDTVNLIARSAQRGSQLASGR